MNENNETIPPPPPPPPAAKPWYLRKRIAIPAAIIAAVALIGIGGAIAGSGDDEATPAASTVAETTTEAPATTVVETTVTPTTTEFYPEVTLSAEEELEIEMLTWFLAGGSDDIAAMYEIYVEVWDEVGAAQPFEAAFCTGFMSDPATVEEFFGMSHEVADRIPDPELRRLVNKSIDLNREALEKCAADIPLGNTLIDFENVTVNSGARMDYWRTQLEIDD